MGKRGDVLVARRRLGFGTEGRPEHFVVVQSDHLALETVLVVPLDSDHPHYEDNPVVVRVTAKEAGVDRPQNALAYLVTAASWERFDDGVVGRLRPVSMALLDRALAVAQDLA